ncbi:MarC family protein [Candidatus Uhrbacteria bacterium]|nr:MarC family protein [Candidatus Uhrbacteria bacterium]
MPFLDGFLKAFFAVFGVMDPVGNVPPFLSLTGKLDSKARRRLGDKAVVRAAVILTVFVFLGNGILDAFHISIESFRIAGGIILVLLGLEIIFGFSLRGESVEAHDDVSVVPLATPLIAGPGTITSAVILAKQYGYAVTLAGIAANLALSMILFRKADTILRLLGTKGTLMFAKVMGLILVAIGVEFIRSGLGSV